jgi:uncharacterized membrane-anchored protein YitT (DUF2179 family)
VGVLAIFRHYSSLGGFSVVGLLVQEKFHIRGGYIQFGLDFVLFLIALTSYSVHVVLISLAGDVMLNLTIALNHRSDRYVAKSSVG